MNYEKGIKQLTAFNHNIPAENSAIRRPKRRPTFNYHIIEKKIDDSAGPFNQEFSGYFMSKRTRTKR